MLHPDITTNVLAHSNPDARANRHAYCLANPSAINEPHAGSDAAADFLAVDDADAGPDGRSDASAFTVTDYGPELEPDVFTHRDTNAPADRESYHVAVCTANNVSPDRGSDR